VTDSVQIALIVAVPPTIAAIGAIAATVLADRRADRKLNHITVLTNSTLSEAKRRIDELEQQVKALRQQL
jgi:polyhydroxyalkanoate synthesis regulator phasin